ncbi:WD40-repeat-containing domain protein [Lentinula aciculospora]|uniref:WD40-repeat-containing domain protein n=1 Tax=Lentinula aciculospora TaxID=153920 RepID=A0A9W9AHU0_9AGAR|nr:WD40-repeat-containing domain protein [Lentinula aciculospora]
MLAITSTDGLSILDHTTVKKAPSSFPSCITLISPPIASSWSSDNKFLFIASAFAMHKYDAEHNSLVDVYSSSEIITSLLVKDKASVVICAGEKVHILDCGATTKISQTFTSHKDTVRSLSLSNDLTLLASTSYDAAYVHNLTLASHTLVRGLPVSDQQFITTCAFHPHTRTRLLIGVGKKLAVYDTTRPSGPLRVIPLNETSSGNICAISCSPFSKTLVAVATTGGTLGLVDLDKEKGLFRTVNVKAPVTTLSFSQEGASIYIGTENGKLLILDLRVLDKPPKFVVLSETGERLTTMSVQAKVKRASDVLTKPTATKGESSKPTSRKPSATISSVSKPSPGRRIVSTSLKGKGHTASTVGTSKTFPAKEKEVNVKKVFSPLRKPLSVSNEGNASLSHDDDFSLQIDSLSAVGDISKKESRSTPEKRTVRLREQAFSALSNSTSTSRTRDIGGARLHPPPQPSPLSVSISRAKVSSKEDPLRRARTVSITSRTAAVPSPLSTSASKKDAVAIPRRSRTISTSSTSAPRASSTTAAMAKTISTSAEPARLVVSHLTAPESTKKAWLSPKSGSNRPGILRTRMVSADSRVSQSKAETKPRTPSPGLSDNQTIAGISPATPLPAHGRRPMASPALHTPGGIEADDDDDVNLLVQENQSRKKNFRKGKARTVLFQDYEENSNNEYDSDKVGVDYEAEEKENEREESLSWQISPRRPGSVGPSSVPSPSPSAPWNGSSIRNSQSYSHPHKPYANIPGSPGGTSPQALLRNIVRDVMYDFHQESRAEMMGLHLDLVKMGRGWKKELRELTGEYGGELKELREENQRLREENERLRKGY